jgi:hypothetical protein
MMEKLGWPTFPYLIDQYLNIFMRNVSMFLPPVKTVFIERRFISGSALQVVIEIKNNKLHVDENESYHHKQYMDN